MQGTIASREYLNSLEQLKKEHARLAEVADAIEWELCRCDAPGSRYPKVGQGAKGPVHYIQTDETKMAPSVIVVFTFEKSGGEEKVLFLDIKIAEGSEEEEIPF